MQISKVTTLPFEGAKALHYIVSVWWREGGTSYARSFYSYLHSMKTDSGPVMAEETSAAPGFKRPAPEQWNEVEGKRKCFQSFVELLLKAAYYSESDSDSAVQDISCESMDSTCTEDLRNLENMSPVDTSGSSAESYLSESSMSFSNEEPRKTGVSIRGQQWSSSPELSPHRESSRRPGSPSSSPSADIEGEELKQVTCYCDKPYAGRAMIECSKCLRWIHLSCAKIRKNNIPDVFWCQKCKDKQYTIRKSKRTPVAKVKKD